MFGGGMLTGAEIKRQYKKGNIYISDFDEKQLNPNSYNLRLHPQLLVYDRPMNSLRLSNLYKKSFYERIKDLKLIETVEKDRLLKIVDEYTEKIKEYSSYELEPEIAYEPVPGRMTDGITVSLATDLISSGIKSGIKSVQSELNMSIKDIMHEIYELKRSIITDNGGYITSLENKAKIEFLFSLFQSIMEENPLDMHKKTDTFELEIPDSGFTLEPGILYIGRTIETTSTDKFIPMINGRSSGGRLGISIHICAGFGDVGFNGSWTLEITCVEPVIVYPREQVAQVCYFKPYGRIGKKGLYNGRYQGQDDATASRFYMGNINE